MKKIHARQQWAPEKTGAHHLTPINPKKYSCYGPKKIHTRNLIAKHNSCGSKIPLPPHNFSNGPSVSLACRTEPPRIAIKGYPPGGLLDDLSVNQALRHEELSNN